MQFFRRGYWQKALSILLCLAEIGSVGLFLYFFILGVTDTAHALAFILSLWAVNAALLAFIIQTEAEPDYKIAWMFMVGGVPIMGPVFYVLYAHKMRTRKQSRFMSAYFGILKHERQQEETMRALGNEHPDAKGVATYILNASSSAIYRNSSVEYFPLGDEALPVMLRELRKARHYIFIEYFIIKPGKMWDAILNVLREKVGAGVDVRVVYDDVGNLGATPKGYDKHLRELGIKAKIFMPIKPIMDIRMNNRDHRKMMIIDGHTCFTGGLNLADEYINEEERFGHWKDNAVMVKGKAVYGFTLLFLSNWIASFEPKERADYDYYRPESFIDEDGGFPVSDGFVQAYGDLPYARHPVGASVYRSLLGKARDRVYISTPYLVLDEKMQSEIRLAALEGLDVRILTPGIPDKKAVYSLTRMNYGRLLEAGVRIYEYTPGFVHQKMFVVDGEMATVGTVNLDYRSLYLHMENGTFMTGCRAIKHMERDFLDTIKVSHEVTLPEWKKMRRTHRIRWFLLRLVAPLL